jgi:putative membrane protein
VIIKIRYQLLQLSSIQMAILTIWALMMVSLPITDWSSGWSAMIGATTVGVSITAGIVLALLWGVWGAAATLRVAGSIFALSWAAEVIGSRTGIPFGTYSYTDFLQPQILNVPLQIPLGWLMMLPPSWGVAQAISDRINPRWKFPAFVGLSALAMTAWDLFLDPMMVTWEMWVWHNPGSYFGIPWINYLGWLLVSALVTILIRPGKLPVAPLLIIYTTIWLLKSVGLGFFWGILGAAIVGSLFMGSITILAWRAFIRRD